MMFMVEEEVKLDDNETDAIFLSYNCKFASGRKYNVS